MARMRLFVAAFDCSGNGAERSGMTLRKVLLAAVLAAAFTLPLLAQGAAQTGSIYGRVTDETGGVLPGVTVTLTGVGAPRNTTTGTQGDFRFINLSPGTYTVKSEL